MKFRHFALAGLLALGTGTASAECTFTTDSEVSLITQGFEAWKAVAAAMGECAEVSVELSQEAQEKQAVGLAANPSLYHLAGVYNSSLVPLLDQGLIRPLDDLVKKYGSSLNPNQLIRVDGNIVAIAMMVNAQHLMYREDILNDLGLAAPETYEEVLAAAEKIAGAGVVEYPIGGSWKTLWLEFVNLYLGYGGEVFAEGNLPSIDNENGIAALETMKSLTAYMDPEYLVSDSTYVQQQFQQGKIAMANFWASRAGAMNDEAESQVVGKVKFAAAPIPITGGRPASTLWWDGIVVAANISDEEAETAFRVALEGMDAEMAQANPDTAIWLITGYEPGETAAGATATAQKGALPFPASTQMGLMQTALANGLPAWLNGSKDAAATLADIEAAYLTSAKEAGLVQ